MVYVCLQELATRISHRGTGKLLEDQAGYKVMARVATDENLHFLFYRDLVNAALEVDPSSTVMAIERQVRDFEMPGTGIPGLLRARPGHRQGRHLRPASSTTSRSSCPWCSATGAWPTLEGLSDEADQARHSVIDRIDRIGRAGRRMAERRATVDA